MIKLTWDSWSGVHTATYGNYKVRANPAGYGISDIRTGKDVAFCWQRKSTEENRKEAHAVLDDIITEELKQQESKAGRDTVIIKQVASNLEKYGFQASAWHWGKVKSFTPSKDLPSVAVAEVTGLVDGTSVFALVVTKGHRPVKAYHVNDFRVGENIYAKEVK